MTSELLNGLIGLAGIIIGALPTYLYMKIRNMAEIEKIKAETEKTKAETIKILKEIQSIRSNESSIDNNNKYPKEFYLSFSARREALTQTQGRILKFFSNRSYAGQYVNQDVLEKQFDQIKPSELYYRLEHLRLLGFLDNQKTGQDENGADQFSFRLSENYRKEIGDPDIFLSISSST
jgi:hypothetical protein